MAETSSKEQEPEEISLEEKLWRDSSNPVEMLDLFEDSHIDNEHKSQLFSLACCRSVFDLLPEKSKKAIEILERFVERDATEEEFNDARKKAADDMRSIRSPRDPAQSAIKAIIDFIHLDDPTFTPGIREIVNDINQAIHLKYIQNKSDAEINTDELELILSNEGKSKTNLLREIFGNPYKQIETHPDWLSWNGGTVEKLAKTIYEDKRFEIMPILADALEEAGCGNADILNHCRQNYEQCPHVRGCWVIDLLLGKK